MNGAKALYRTSSNGIRSWPSLGLPIRPTNASAPQLAGPGSVFLLTSNLTTVLVRMTSLEIQVDGGNEVMKGATGRLGLNLLFWLGCALLAASGVLHFHLWGSEGYRHIPTIGPLFLTQAIIGVLLALATAVFRKLVLVAAAAGLAISSIGALLVSIWWGLFGWQESSSAPYVGMAFALEAAAAVLLSAGFVVMAWSWLSRAASFRAAAPDRARALPQALVLISSGDRAKSAHPSAGRGPSGASSEVSN
jgi:hypothetical protein